MHMLFVHYVPLQTAPLQLYMLAGSSLMAHRPFFFYPLDLTVEVSDWLEPSAW
jgi:hypothetical protein